jgi:hypothetical protein
MIEVPDGTPVIVSDGGVGVGVGVGEATVRVWRLADGARSCLLSAYRTGTQQRPHVNIIIAAAGVMEGRFVDGDVGPFDALWSRAADRSIR